MDLTVTQEPLIMTQSPLVLLKRLGRGWNTFRNSTQFYIFALASYLPRVIDRLGEIGGPDNLLQGHLHI
jgi:hypothetical protein